MDNKYSIKIAIDKQDLGNVSQDMRKIMDSFKKTTEMVKPLADSLNAAFSTKSLENINKITSGLAHLDKTIGGLTTRLEKLGINLSNLSTSQAFGQIKGMGGLVDQYGRPYGGGGAAGGGGGLPPPPSSGGGQPPSGGGGGGFYDLMGMLPGGANVANVARRLGLGPAGLRAMGIVGGAAALPIIAGNIAGSLRATELSRLNYERFGVNEAMRGNIGDYLLGNSPLTTGDKLRIGGSVTGTIMKHVGIGAAGGAAVGLAGMGVGALPGAIIGGAGGLITGGISGIKSYYDTRNRIQQENTVLNEESRMMLNQIGGYTRSIEPSERIMGAGRADRALLSGATRFGQGAATDFLNRMTVSGISVDADMMGQSMGLERQYRAGALVDLFGRRAGKLGPRQSGDVLSTLAGAGLTEGGEDLVLRERAAEFIANQASSMGILNNISGFGAYAGSFMSDARDRGMSVDTASRVGAMAFGARQNLYSGAAGTEVVMSGLAGLGITNFADSAKIQNLIRQGRIEDASALIKQKAPSADQSQIDKVINRPLELQQRVAAAMGFGNVQEMGESLGSDELGQAFGVAQRAGRASMGTGLSQEARDPSRVQGAERTRAERLEATTAEGVLPAIQKFAQNIEEAVVPVMRTAAEEFSKKLNEQLKNNPRLAPFATPDKVIGKGR